ncbi:MAG: DUF1329 domain-containing protein [Candidatus Binataceae bacterium]
MQIVPTGHLAWPPPYQAATEKYAAQVRLNDKGELDNYVAGLPFPLLDPNDPQVATKVMWNFSFRPLYTDDVDIRDVEIESFAPKIEDFNYRLLGIKPMLACVHAQASPAKACKFDNNRSVCTEDWEMRNLYVIEATEKPQSWHQKIGTDGLIIPKRILYIDSEGWFITASDQYDKQGKLWKTIVAFNTYRDRPVPDAKVAIYPFKRMFKTALVDEDIQDGYSTVVYTPGHDTEEHECWYINMGVVTRSFLDPHRMAFLAR